MKLSLGQAAKEVGKSKTAIANAVKSGRLSAEKTDTGGYAIDPAELFRVYPPKKVDGQSGSTKDAELDSKVTGVNRSILTEKVNGLERVIEEKEKQIQILNTEKDAVRQDLEDQKEQAKKITLLLEHKSSDEKSWETAFKQLEERISNQEDQARKEMAAMRRKATEKIEHYKKAFEEEKSRSFWSKLFG